MLFLLKLLLPHAKDFLTKNWKLLLAGAAAIALFFVLQHMVTSYGDTRYREGVEATLNKMKTEVKKTDVANRKQEKQVDTDLNDFAKQKAKQDQVRDQQEDKIQNRVHPVLDSVPMWKSEECSITEKVLQDRNAIRLLGPSAEADK